MSIAGVLLALAIPNLREFIVRNKMAALANEFSAGVSQTRTEAVTRNSCVSMCQSVNTQNAISGGTLSCTTTGLDWLRGWIIFVNPTCSATLNTPVAANGEVVLRVVQPAGDGYEIINVGGTNRKIMFDGRGLPNSGMANMTLTGNDDSVTQANRRQICISAAGRVTIRKLEGGDCTN